MENQQKESKMIVAWEFLKKTWKFFAGFALAIIGAMLLSRKDETGALIEETTKHGNEGFDNILDAHEKKREKLAIAEDNHKKEVSSIEEEFSNKKEEIISREKDFIEKKIDDDLENATDLLAKELDALNLDD